MDNGIKLSEQANKYISGIRLYRYNKSLSIDSEGVMELYFLNLSISQEILGLISIFEIIFRNRIHNTLKHLNYLDSSSNLLRKCDYEVIIRENKKISKEKNPPKNIESRVIASLTLGFWCTLFKNDKLWSSHLSKIFEKKVREKNSITFGKINNDLENIKNIRNKIAHHERIIFKHGIILEDYIDSIIQTSLSMINREDIEFLRYIENEFNIRKNRIKEQLNMFCPK